MTKEGANMPKPENETAGTPVPDQPDKGDKEPQRVEVWTRPADTVPSGRHGGVGQPLSEENAAESRRGVQGEDLPSLSMGDVMTKDGAVFRPADPTDPPPSHFVPTNPTDESWSQDAVGTVVNPEADEVNPSREVSRQDGLDDAPVLVGVTEQRAVHPNMSIEQPELVPVETVDPYEEVRKSMARNATTMPVGQRGFVMDTTPPGRPASDYNADGTLKIDKK